jgi:hypothetical protein
MTLIQTHIMTPIHGFLIMTGTIAKTNKTMAISRIRRAGVLAGLVPTRPDEAEEPSNEFSCEAG